MNNMKEELEKALKDYQEAIEFANNLNLLDEDSWVLEDYLYNKNMDGGLCYYFKYKATKLSLKFEKLLTKYMDNPDEKYCYFSDVMQSIQWNIDNALQPRVDLLKQMIKDLET